MADIEYTIRKLIEQQNKVNNGDAEVWLNTSYSFIEDYFKSYSTRARTFRSLISDYRLKKIGDEFSPNKLDPEYFKNKGLEYIQECLHYLNEQKDLKLRETENNNTEIMGRRIKSFDDFADRNTPNQSVRNSSSSSNVKTRLPFGIPAELFWTIFTAIVLVSFFLGLYFGQAKFDKEKIDFYEENKRLKLQVYQKEKEIEKLKTEIKTRPIKLDNVSKDGK